MSDNNSWALSKVWNESLDTDRQRELVERDYAWASELGQSFYDRYFKMRGRKMTTPPNLRARRKFEAGNLTEWVVLQVLRRAHVLQDSQQVIEYDEGAIKVRGRCDFIAGGEPVEVDLSDLPDTLAMISEAALARLKETFPNGLATQGLELKSTSSFMFGRYERAPAEHHGLQAYHYAHKMEMPFHLIYLSRDDLRMVEWVIEPNSEKWGKLYHEDLEKMAWVNSLTEDAIAEATYKGEPIKEPLLVWNKEDEKFEKNWRVEYSGYLEDYGFERPDLYADKAKVATRLNNVVKSIKAGKKLSKLNYEAIDLGVAFYPLVADRLEALKEKYHYGEV